MRRDLLSRLTSGHLLTRYLPSPAALDEHRVGPVDEDVRDVGVVEKRLEGAEAEEVGAERVGSALVERRARGEAHPLPQKPALGRVRVRAEKLLRGDARRDLLAEP